MIGPHNFFSRRRAAAVVLFSAAFLLGFALQQTKPSIDSVLESLDAVKSFRSVTISPDGTRVAWVQRIPDKPGAQQNRSAIYVADIKSPRPRRITAAKDQKDHREHSPVWSPDGGSLAFLSDAAKEKQLDLYAVSATGATPKKLTNLTGHLASPRWSPHGKSIAFLFIENASREAGALVPSNPDAGVVEEKIEEERIATVDVATGRVRQVSPPDVYVYEYDWSPDGKSFAATAAKGMGDNNWWIAELFTIDVASGNMTSILKPPLQIANPRWSPDGRTIAYIHGIMSDFGSTGGDVFTVSAFGAAEPRNLTPGRKASANWLSWDSSGEILFTEHVDGGSGIRRLNPSDGRITPLRTEPEAISLSASRDGLAAAAMRHSFQQAPEIWAGPIGSWQQVTHVNASAKSFWGEARSLHWESDGMTVQGWLLCPKEFDPSARHPMVVSIHGGPAAVHTPGWPLRWTAALPSQGYFVFLPNPRGSYGQGEAFTQGNVQDFGYGDLRDIVKGVDEVLRIAPVDKDRIGITGWSYGGYMTMWAVTQTERFRAAVAGAGISNWQSYYGQNRIDRWMIPYFGASVYDDAAIYAKSSPLTFITRVKTPTLILQGDRDAEVPAPQAYEFWHALKTLGVATQLVIYPNEGHAISKPEHQKDIVKRLVAWFDKYLKGTEGTGR